MPRPQQPPAYLKSRSSTGHLYARTKLFGKPIHLGAYGSPESHAKYQQILTQWRTAMATAGGAPRISQRPDVPTLAELVARFLEHADKYYRRPDGSQTSEVESFRLSAAPLLALYGGTPTADFDAAMLEQVRDSMIDGSWMNDAERAKRKKHGSIRWARKTINQRLGRIVRMFRWGVPKKLAPAVVWQELRSVRGLALGRSQAVDHPDREPVPFEHVKATLPHLGRVVRAMVELQLVTGMRPMEVRLMRSADVDRKGVVEDGVRVWVYRPAHHKLAWRNKVRAIALGPRAQAALDPFLDRPAEAWLFSPAEAELERRAAMRAARKTPVQPSQLCRKKAAPRRSPGDQYDVSSYAKAVLAAARKAKVPDWTPGQLRKAAGTEIEELFDLDHARAALGHDTATTTKRWYARADLRKAAKVAARMG